MNEQMIAAIIAGAKPVITADLSETDAAQLVESFRSMLSQLSTAAAQVPIKPNPALESKAGKDLADKLAAQQPANRLKWLAEERFGQIAYLLSAEAFRLARACLGKPGQLAVLKPRLEELLRHAEQLHAEMTSGSPALKARYGQTLADTLLDCRFTLGLSTKSSLRLGRLLKVVKPK